MNPKNIGTYEFTIDAYLADFRGKATLPMMGNFMLQAATKHAEERGFGFSAMKNKGLAWVLSRMVIELYDYPKNDTRMKIHTWVRDVNKLFTERCFSFDDENGNCIGYSRSIWAAIDLESRRPTNILDLYGLSDYLDEKPCPVENIRKILPIKESKALDDIVVRYSDVDINKHLNSMKYIEYFVNLFNIELFTKKDIRRFAINFLKEAHYGDRLQSYIHNELNDVYTLELRNNDTIISSARVVWAPF